MMVHSSLRLDHGSLPVLASGMTLCGLAHGGSRVAILSSVGFRALHGLDEQIRKPSTVPDFPALRGAVLAALGGVIRLAAMVLRQGMRPSWHSAAASASSLGRRASCPIVRYGWLGLF